MTYQTKKVRRSMKIRTRTSQSRLITKKHRDGQVDPNSSNTS